MAKSKSNTIQVLQFTGEIEVRSIVDKNGAPRFFAVDVCNALDIGNPSQALRRLDEDDKTTLTNNEGQAGNGAQEYNIINESGLYSLILTSRKAEAKRFKKWVTAEVLPTIRKTGSYQQSAQAEKPLALPNLNIKHYWVTTNSRGETIRNVPLTAPCKLAPLVDEYFDDAMLMVRADMVDFMDQAIHTVWEMDKRLQAMFSPMRRIMAGKTTTVGGAA